MIVEIKIILKKILFKIKWYGFCEFHHFNFNHDKPLPKNSFNKFLNVIEEIQGLSTGVIRITDGTLLGIVRENKFIKHDNDIDFDCLYTDPGVIINYAKKNGWKLGRKVTFKGKVQQLIFFDQDKILYDFIFWYENNEFAVNYSERRFVRLQRLHFIKNYRILNLNNKSVHVPDELDEWLVMRYGKNWNIPHTEKGDWKNDCDDLLRLDLFNRAEI